MFKELLSNFFTLLPIPASIVLNSSSVYYKKGRGEKHINSCDQELCNDNNKLKRKEEKKGYGPTFVMISLESSQVELTSCPLLELNVSITMGYGCVMELINTFND